MTISLAQNAARVSYSVSEGATQTSFTVSFEFFDDADLNVYVDGTLKTITTHYSVSGGSGSTGAVAISVTGATGGSTVVITRNIALARTTDFPTSGSFQIATLNTELDRFTAIAADLKDSVDRGLILSDSDSSVSTTLPLLASRKGTVLGFNASTGAVEAGPSITAVQSLADVTASINLLGTSAVVEDMGLLSATAVIEDMSLLGTAAVVEDMSLLATSAVIEDMGLLATSAVIEDMGLLGTSANVTAMGLLGNSTVITNMSNLSASAVIADMAILGTTDVVADMAILGTSDVVSDMNTLATSANVTAMGLLGTSAVVEDMGFLGTAAVVEDMGILGTSANVTAMSNVSGSISNVNTVATNISGVNNFAAQYRTGSSDPTSSLDEGDLFYNTTANQLKIYNGSAWENAAPAGSGFLATSGGTMTGNLSLGNNVIAKFGDGEYLKIYHSSSNNSSYIAESGTGDLNISGTIMSLKASNNDTYIRCVEDSYVRLYHDNATVLQTQSNGINVTGNVIATGTVQAEQFNNDEALPDVRPSLLLDFANSKTLDPRITFTRGSTATYWDGKTTTKAEENLHEQSQAFHTSPWDSIRLNLTGSQTAPDGTSTAFLVEQQTGETVGGNLRQLSKALIAGEQYTFSIFAKADTKDFLYVNVNYASTAQVWFDLANGTVETETAGIDSANITSMGSGWYRCSAQFTVVTATSTIFYHLADTDNSSAVTDSGGIYLWGAQLEQRSAATAYTATTSAPIVKYQPTLQTAASGAARFDHSPTTGESKGLLIEEARTNLLPYSEAFDNAAWSKSQITVISNSTVAPDGTQTSDVLIPTAVSGLHNVSDGASVTSGTTYTFSAYVKASGYSGVSLDFSDSFFGSPAVAKFDLQNGTIVGPSSGTDSITDVGNGWYKITSSCVATASGTSTFFIQVHDGTVSFTGNTYSGVFLWGAQLEAGAFPTSYIPTSGSTVTRVKEVAYLGYADMGWNDQETTIYAEVSRDYVLENTYPRILDASQFYILGDASQKRLSMQSTNYGTAASVGGVADSFLAGTHKLAGAFDNNVSFSLATDGAVNTQTGVQYFVVPLSGNNFYLLSTQSDTRYFNGYMKKLAIYPKRLSNATLQAMTTE